MRPLSFHSARCAAGRVTTCVGVVQRVFNAGSAAGLSLQHALQQILCLPAVIFIWEILSQCLQPVRQCLELSQVCILKKSAASKYQKCAACRNKHSVRAQPQQTQREETEAKKGQRTETAESNLCCVQHTVRHDASCI